MAAVYEIIAEPPKITLEPKTRSGSFALRVTNKDSRRRRGLLSVAPLDDAQKDWPKDWLKVEGELRHDFDAGETEPYTIVLTVPMVAKTGSYRIRPDVEDEERPDTHSATGPILEFVVPESVQPPPPPWKKWWPYAVAAAVVLVIGAVLFLLLSRVEVPNVVGTNVAVAKPTLEASGLRQGTPTIQRTLEKPAGIIVEQNPRAGERVSGGTLVDLVVAECPDRVLVPNLVGQSQTQAQTLIEGNCLRVGTVTETGLGPLRTVTSQSPGPGASVAASTAVNLVVIRRFPDFGKPEIPLTPGVLKP